MLTANSPISEIALEAKDTSDDVRQVAMAIEASCKHVDNSVSSMKLGGVPKFVDDFPVSGITITPGMLGYGSDTKNNDYDVTHIFEKQHYDGVTNPKIESLDAFPLTYNTDFPCYVFSNDNLIRVANEGAIAFYSPSGNTIKTVTSFPSTNSVRHTFYRGSFYGGSDVYIRGCISNSEFIIEHYNSVGDKVKSVTLDSINYYTYQSLSFDGEYYYFVSRRTSSGSWFLEKYNDLGVLVNSVIVPSLLYIVVTENYLLLLGTYSTSEQTVYDKDLNKINTFKITGSTDEMNMSGFCNLLGLDFVAVGYGYKVYLFDLTLLKSSLIVGYNFTARVAQHGSYFICASGSASNALKVDYQGNFITDSIGGGSNILASNGSTIYRLYKSIAYRLKDKSTKQLACLAQKRG